MKTLLLSCFIACAVVGCGVRHNAQLGRSGGDAEQDESYAQWLQHATDKISTREAVGGRLSYTEFTISGTNITIIENRVIFVPQ
jgi:hypothetical protein